MLEIGLQPEDAKWELEKLKYERRFYQSKNVGYWKKCSHIFTTFLKPFGISLGLAAFAQLVGTSAFLYYGPSVLKDTQIDVSNIQDQDESADIIDNFIIIFFVLGNLVSAMLINKTGRKMMVMIALPVATATAIGLSYTMHESNYGDEDEGEEDVK